MFERRGWIARSFLLLLVVMPFLIGACAQEASALSIQPTPPSQRADELISAGIASLADSIRAGIAVPGVAPILAAIIAGCFGWAIAEFYTKRLKQIEATLEFSKRFHELIQQQRVLNRKYDEDRLKGQATSAADAIDKEDADAWWWRFFDLLQYEYDFYQKGMIRKARFEEWMVWRWNAFHPEEGKEWKTCGIEYREAWATWTERPAQPSRLIKLLTEIHGIGVPPNLTQNDRNRVLAKSVRDKVKPHGPRWWKSTDLYKASRDGE